MASQFWYGAQGLPQPIKQANGGYKIALAAKDLPAVVNFPSGAKVIRK